MTREEFIIGKEFTISPNTYRGESTYNYVSGENVKMPGSIYKQLRSSISGDIVINDYHLNIEVIGPKAFLGFVYVMGKQVTVKYRYEDLKLYMGVNEY